MLDTKAAERYESTGKKRDETEKGLETDREYGHHVLERPHYMRYDEEYLRRLLNSDYAPA